MPDYGITDAGFNRKRADTILEEINADMKSVFGENLNVEPESPDGQVNGILAESFANLWELAEYAYNAFNPSGATGATLANLVQLNSINKLEATFSTIADVTLGGTPGAVIPAGSLMSTSDTASQFATDEEVTLNGVGVGVVNATAVLPGPIAANTATLINIDTPVSGWTLCFNNNSAVEGTNQETDAELRARRERSVAIDAQSIADSISAAVGDVDGVIEHRLIENDTTETDTNGIPARSFQVIVVGGLDADIAQAIYSKKTIGIPSFGTTSVEVTDSQGYPKTIRFTRATEVEIFVEVDLTTNSNYPFDGDDQIKQAIVDYSNGDLVEGRDFSLGDDVIYSRMYTPINSVPGHEVDALRIGITPSPTGTVNIPIAIDEISKFVITNITVNS